MNQKTYIRSIVLAIIVSLAFAWPIMSDVPTAINYQGRLTNGTGNPVPNGSYTVVFTIYDAASGGESKWTETQSINTTDGLFAVLLGSINPIKDTVFSAPTRYLGIKVGTDPELSPRTMIVTVPYAMRVSTVDGATGGNITSKVSIGTGHTNSGENSFVAGLGNDVSGYVATISGGQFNTARGLLGAVGGGELNTASMDGATVGGGAVNAATGEMSVVAGGRTDTASGHYSAIVGGTYNKAKGTYSFVGGGYGNTASGGEATVGGGYGNIASGIDAAVGGGFGNKATYYYATVGGGTSNTASEQYCTVGGGANNNATGMAATVSGGDINLASGQWATVPGGLFSTAAADFSFAAGRSAKANHGGTFVWADSTNDDFASTGGNQFLIRATGGVGIGTNSPQARLHIKGAGWPKSFGYFDTDAISQDAGLRFYEDGTPKSHVFHASGTNTLNLYGDGYSGIAVSSTGNVGIGTTSPSEKLQVNGNICYTGSIGACSDLRYKKDITVLLGSLEKVTKIRGITYRWRKDEFPDKRFDDSLHLGFIAQEVEQLYPEMVLTDKNSYKSVDYSRLTPVLVEAIKEQQMQIDELRVLVNQLASRTNKSEATYGLK